MLRHILAKLSTIEEMLQGQQYARQKQWFTPDEVASILHRKNYTVREWCRWGRIRSEKDEYTGKRRIPADEVNRLLAGGSPLPAKPEMSG